MPRRLLPGLIEVFGLAFAMTFTAIVEAGAQEPMTTALTRDEGRVLLSRVESWGCQYQNIDLQRIAGSSLDLIVIDPILDGASGRVANRNEISAVQRKPDGGRRLVFAYLSIGAAEEYRTYWNPRWLDEKPLWLGRHDPDWPRSHSVKYWYPDWQRIVADALKQIVAAGFDGAFLDRVDAYDDWRSDHPQAVDDMADFVIRLSDTARKIQPGFLLISQNAEIALSKAPYRATIDAVSKESLLTGLQGEGTANRPDQIAWSLNHLLQAQLTGLTILTIEYLRAHEDVAAVQERHRTMGFVPFLANRLLDRLP